MSQTAALELARAFTAINEATRKAHEAIADLRAERALLAEERKAVEALHAGIAERINSDCGAMIVECVQSQLAQLHEQVETQRDLAVAKVEKSFERLEAIYLGGTGPNVAPIEDAVIGKIAQAIMARRNL